jgi:hypothetical protein
LEVISCPDSHASAQNLRKGRKPHEQGMREGLTAKARQEVLQGIGVCSLSAKISSKSNRFEDKAIHKDTMI